MLNTGCGAGKTEPAVIDLEPEVRSLQLDSVESHGKVHKVEIEVGEYFVLSTEEDKNDYEKEWIVVSDTPEIVLTALPSYNEDEHLESFYSFTGMTAGKSRVVFSEFEGHDMIVFEVEVISR